MSEERLAYDNYILQRELDRRGDPSLDPCERIGHELDMAQTRIATQEIEIARLTTLVAEGERREALLTAFVVTHDEELYSTQQYMNLSRDHDPDEIEAISAAFLDAPILRRAARQALTDAGFTPDGWKEDKQ